MIIAFTGAGISKESNIPTFMERPAIRSKLTRTYASSHPRLYNEVIRELKDNISGAKPNDAHYALAEYNIPVITMNIDGLHTLAGSDNILELHGSMPADDEMDIAYKLVGKPVLYEDPAPAYQTAYEMVANMKEGDIFLVIGASTHTAVSYELRELAKSRGAKVIEIQDNAATKTRQILESLVGN